MPRLIRITTVPISLHLLLQGQFRYMQEHGFDVIAMSSDGKEVDEVVKNGTRHIVIPLTRKITPLHDLRCLWKLVREIRKLKPDIVHTHTPKAGLLGMLASWICGVPVRLHTVAGLPLMEARGIKRRVLEAAERITYACAHVVYPNSAGLKTFIDHALRVPDHKIKIIGKGSSNGIDTVYFDRTPELEGRASELRRRFGIKEDDLVCSFVGRIVRDKGIVELVKAFQDTSDLYLSDKTSRGKLFLMLVGNFEEDLDPLPRDVLEFLKRDNRVILAGFQADIRPWIMASDLFVFPSYREGFPNVVMQASLLMVPCIVSDINGCNEIVQHGNTGVVVPPKNIEALTKAMKMLIDNKVQRLQYALSARNYVAENFKREYVWEALRKEYEWCLKPKA